MIIKTYEEILETALAKIKDDIDTREGSLIHTAIAPICTSLAQAYIDIKNIYDLGFIDYAVDEYLDITAGQFGVFRAKASKCVKIASYKGKTNNVISKKFIVDDIIFVCTKIIDENYLELTAQEDGLFTNSILGEATSLEYIDGLENVIITKNNVLGTDKETDENFRKRALEFIKTPAFGGNIADYKAKLLSITGINNVEVFTASTMGAGKVGIIIAGSFGEPLSTEFCKKVLEIFKSNGDGLAPIGHDVSIKSSRYKNIDIKIKITTTGEIADEFIIAKVREKIIKLIESFSFNAKLLSVSRIIGAVLSVESTLDTIEILINGSPNNTNIIKIYNNFQIIKLRNVDIEVV